VVDSQVGGRCGRLLRLIRISRIYAGPVMPCRCLERATGDHNSKGWPRASRALLVHYSCTTRRATQRVSDPPAAHSPPHAARTRRAPPARTAGRARARSHRSQSHRLSSNGPSALRTRGAAGCADHPRSSMLKVLGRRPNDEPSKPLCRRLERAQKGRESTLRVGGQSDLDRDCLDARAGSSSRPRRTGDGSLQSSASGTGRQRNWA
jgi:hypothetical protein